MGIFGWSYPAGCSGTPYDEWEYCEMCGLCEDSCICPECPECSAVGDPACYREHGLIETQDQRDSREREAAKWADQP